MVEIFARRVAGGAVLGSAASSRARPPGDPQDPSVGIRTAHSKDLDWDGKDGWLAWTCALQSIIQLELFVPRETDLENRGGRTTSGYVFPGMCLLETAPREIVWGRCGHGSLGLHHLPNRSGLPSDSLGKSLNLGGERGGKGKKRVYRDLGVG